MAVSQRFTRRFHDSLTEPVNTMPKIFLSCWNAGLMPISTVFPQFVHKGYFPIFAVPQINPVTIRNCGRV
jgi:hypothetical protein